MDRLPPHSHENEQGVLGACLMNPSECVDLAISRLGRAGDAAFYDLRHRTLWKHILALHQIQDEFDITMLLRAVQEAGEIDKIGGMAYLSEIQDHVPSAANLPSYLEVVFEQYLLRQVVSMTSEAQELAYSDRPARVILDLIEGTLLALGDLRDNETVSKLAELLEDLQERRGNYVRGSMQMKGISSGYAYFDKMTGGLQGGQMVVIAARPSMGKSSFAWCLASQVAEQHIPAAFFSFEMSSRQLGDKYAFQRAEADYQRWRTGFAAEADEEPLDRAIENGHQVPLYVDDGVGVDLYELRSRCRRYVRKYGVRIFFIDYLQLMAGTGNYRDRREEIAEASAGIKRLARDLDVPIVVLAQMNRDFDKEPNRKPRLSDIKDCGNIEQDADLIVMLHEVPDYSSCEELCRRLLREAAESIEGVMRPRRKSVDEHGEPIEVLDSAPAGDYSNHVRRIWAEIVKQREGPTGPVQMVFHKASTRFYERVSMPTWSEMQAWKSGDEPERPKRKGPGEINKFLRAFEP